MAVLAALVFSASALAGQKGTIRCTFPVYSDIAFRVDLATGTVVAKSGNGPSIAGRWKVQAHFLKQGGRFKSLASFELRNSEKKNELRTLVLAGDNGDDTDFIFTLSYQNCPMADFDPDSRETTCHPRATVATLVDFGGSEADQASVHSTQSCTIEGK